MLFTVSTAKDTRENLERFVARNLAGGADHLFVFLDAAGQPGTAEAQAFLEGHPHVTCIPTDEAYWRGERPDDLNTRQVLNANLVLGVLAPFEWVDWLFSIDADEVLELDRQRLLEEVAASQPAVTLEPIEAVSRMRWEGEVTHFKRLLTEEELSLLVALGVLDRADNKDYFRGHTHGKPGVRPGLERRFQLHRVVRDDMVPVPAHRAEWLRLRHYESYDGTEFVRKWMAHVSAGPVRFRPNRERLLVALDTLVRMDGLDEERRQHYLMRLYRRWVEDDAEVLSDLGLLEAPPPGRHQPEAFPPRAREEMESLLAVLVGAEKRGPSPAYRKRGMVQHLRSLRPQLSPPLSRRVAAEVRRAQAALDVIAAQPVAAPPDPDVEPSGGRRQGGLASRFPNGSPDGSKD